MGILKAMQTELRVSLEQARERYDRVLKDKSVQNKKLSVAISLEKKLNLSVRLPLPQISSEYGVATLLLRVKVTGLLFLLNSLLLERSVLVIGSSYEEVTSCASAL